MWHFHEYYVSSHDSSIIFIFVVFFLIMRNSIAIGVNRTTWGASQNWRPSRLLSDIIHDCTFIPPNENIVPLSNNIPIKHIKNIILAIGGTLAYSLLAFYHLILSHLTKSFQMVRWTSYMGHWSYMNTISLIPFPMSQIIELHK